MLEYAEESYIGTVKMFVSIYIISIQKYFLKDLLRCQKLLHAGTGRMTQMLGSPCIYEARLCY